MDGNRTPQALGSIAPHKKPFGAEISAWALHDLSRTLKTSEQKDLFEKRCAGCAPIIFTGQVDVDHLNRWPNGSCMRSSLVTEIDRDSWLIETQNTRYKLTGPGRITTQPPGEYEFEVGKTLMLLNPIDGFSVEGGTTDYLIFPDIPESLLPLDKLIATMR